ncbi:hypothetical protein H6G17_08975 [Chroococcidiopsis sp. FACHB-1243]|uniref:hypothetical protein n=1 Tax=Chroococcidiopsis sp. [FACHB-1243] TaxID=2692781 RepID=UPI00177B3DEE|nr:hypothetical protein [Chroococcidiopsis sp. [FACHB-1243]]MBD2305649.1 hypothetical protein [Chroococcidiopsis sp. [FACHB-1243]]
MYGTRIEIEPYPLQLKKIEKEWQKILSKLGKTYTRGKITNFPNDFWFETEEGAIQFVKECWGIQLSDRRFTIKTLIQFPTSYQTGINDERGWIAIAPKSLFLLTTIYKDEFTAGLIAPFQQMNVEDFIMGQDTWDLQAIEQLEQRNGRQWFNALDRSSHQEHQGTYVGQILFYIDCSSWQDSTCNNPARNDGYFQVRDIANGDRYTFTSVKAVGLNTGEEQTLPMSELYIRRSPLILEIALAKHFFNEAYSFLVDSLKDEVEIDFYPLNVYLWDEWNLDKKLQLLNFARFLFIEGIVPPNELGSEELDAAIAAIFINVKHALIGEIETSDSSEQSTYWRSFILDVFHQVYSRDKQDDTIREILAIETRSQTDESLEQLALWYFNEYPLTVFSLHEQKWDNVIYYLANNLCQVDLSEFEDYYEYEE